MRHLRLFEEFVSEKFADVYPKNSWVDLSMNREEFAEIVDLINNAYKNVAGGTLEDPEKIVADKDVTFWQGNDMDEDPECDAVIFGKNTAYGIKLIGMGQDGSRAAQIQTIKNYKGILSKDGFYTEISPSVLGLLGDIPCVDNKEEVERVLNKKIEWVGKEEGLKCDGWYYRDIHGHRKLKLLIGKPKIK